MDGTFNYLAPRSRFHKFNAGQKSSAQAVQKPRQYVQRSLSGHQVQGSAFRNRAYTNHSYSSAYSRNNSAGSGESLDNFE
jgi:hypothetical protein